MLILAFWYVPACFAVDVVEATRAINQAELDLNSAIDCVADAADAGAKVTILLEKLDLAGDLLTKAHLAFRANEYEYSNLLAIECINALDIINSNADILQAEAENAKSDILLLTTLGSGIGLVLLLVLSIIIWRVIRKLYSKQILRMRPAMEDTL